MLIDFSVCNFGPLRERATLSMQATAYSEHPENRIGSDRIEDGVLTCAAVFGANSSGKTFILKAVRALQDTVSEIRGRGEKNRWHLQFGLRSETAAKPVEICMHLLTDGTLYEYSVSFTEKGITSESLYSFPTGRRRRVFDRNIGKEIRKSVIACTSDRTAYLASAAVFNDEVCEKVRKEILSMMWVSTADPDLIGLSASLVCSYPDMKHKFMEKMKRSGMDVTDIICKERRRADGRMVYDVAFEHSSDSEDDGTKFILPISRESEGVKEIFGVSGAAIHALDTGRTVIIDDLGAHLHPTITRSIVSEFNDSTSGSQLIFSTHDLLLMDTRDLFRRDQIYFTNRNTMNGTAELYSLSDFKDVDADSDVIGLYLEGRFDAIP